MLRIIAGIYRSRQLKQPPITITRATKDRVREAVFAAIGAKVIEANVLDLFAGSGAYGIEAYSRGASFVHFNDAHSIAIEVIQENLQALKVVGYQVTQLDAINFLNEPGSLFDLIFIDPPYQWTHPNQLVNLATSRLKSMGVLVYESESEMNVLSQDIFRTKTYNYGRTYVHISWKLI